MPHFYIVIEEVTAGKGNVASSLKAKRLPYLYILISLAINIFIGDEWVLGFFDPKDFLLSEGWVGDKGWDFVNDLQLVGFFYGEHQIRIIIRDVTI